MGSLTRAVIKVRGGRASVAFPTCHCNEPRKGVIVLAQHLLNRAPRSPERALLRLVGVDSCGVGEKLISQCLGSVEGLRSTMDILHRLNPFSSNAGKGTARNQGSLPGDGQHTASSRPSSSMSSNESRHHRESNDSNAGK